MWMALQTCSNGRDHHLKTNSCPLTPSLQLGPLVRKKTSSHPHTHTPAPSHPHSLIRYPHTPTLSHPHTLTLSHSHTLTSSYPHTLTPVTHLHRSARTEVPTRQSQSHQLPGSESRGVPGQCRRRRAKRLAEWHSQILPRTWSSARDRWLARRGSWL